MSRMVCCFPPQSIQKRGTNLLCRVAYFDPPSFATAPTPETIEQDNRERGILAQTSEESEPDERSVRIIEPSAHTVFLHPIPGRGGGGGGGGVPHHGQTGSVGNTVSEILNKIDLSSLLSVTSGSSLGGGMGGVPAASAAAMPNVGGYQHPSNSYGGGGGGGDPNVPIMPSHQYPYSNGYQTHPQSQTQYHQPQQQQQQQQQQQTFPQWTPTPAPPPVPGYGEPPRAAWGGVDNYATARDIDVRERDSGNRGRRHNIKKRQCKYWVNGE